MARASSSDRVVFYRSIVFKNVFAFLVILLVAVVPLALRYHQDSRDYEIRVLASQLEFFAERGASWIDPQEVAGLTRAVHMRTPTFRRVLDSLNRIEKDFGVDNAVLMRREPDGRFTYIAIGESAFGASRAGETRAGNPCRPSSPENPCDTRAAQNPCNPRASGNPCSPTGAGGSIFDIGRSVHIHGWFPATYKSTNDTWLAGEMMHSQLFGGRVGEREFDQFMQINTPLKHQGRVVAILMLNKFANPVADAVRKKTLKVVGLTALILCVGLALFGGVAARMLRPLRDLTEAAVEVSRGNLETPITQPRSRDEVGRLTAAFCSMLEGLRQRDFIRNTFGRYLSQKVVDQLLSSPEQLELGGELRQVTLLVSDLRGFTSVSSRLAPQEIIQVINRYLEQMVESITRFEGMVDEFQGDGILALFGVPLASPDDAERALACAIEMQIAMEKVNAELHEMNMPALEMGIGINSGEVVVGNIGSEKRTKYGVIGSAVNEAFRIESYTVGGQILISPSSYDRVRELVHLRGTLEAQFKGLDKPVTLYDVERLEGNHAAALPEKVSEALADIDPAVHVRCYPLEGKTVTEKAISGLLTRLGGTSIEVLLQGEVEAHSSLRIHFLSPDAHRLSPAYGKVERVEIQEDPSPRARTCLRMTSVPEEVARFLEGLRKTSPGTLRPQ